MEKEVSDSKLYLENRDIEILTEDICVQIEQDGFVPDMIVGLARGGLIPGVMISHYFDIKFVPLMWSTRDHTARVSDCKLAEDSLTKKILIVDDICDTGTTFEEIKKDWQSSVSDTIDWHTNVRFASLHIRNGCLTTVDYTAEVAESSIWLVYPWESWFI